MEMSLSQSVREGIPTVLVREALKALPDETAGSGGEAKRCLQAWFDTPTGTVIPLDDLRRGSELLDEYAHSNASSEGLIGWLPQHVGGHLFEQDQYDATSVSVLCVLSLAIRRLLVLSAVGAEVIRADDVALGVTL